MAHLSFSEKLDQAWQLNDSLLCVGLDPDPDRFAQPWRGHSEAIAHYTQAIITATADYSCAYKFQIAHYASRSAESQLAETIGWLKAKYPKHLVILDAKRGDIGSTAEHYAEEAFGRYQADAVTLNPYLGRDALAPFLQDPKRGGILLCRTSNSGSAELQAQGEPPLYVRVAEMAARLWQERANVGLVVGATWPDVLRQVRRIAEAVPILAPGIGTQQGNLEAALSAGLNASGNGLLMSASRSICYASEGADFAEAARAEAARLALEMNRVRATMTKGSS